MSDLFLIRSWRGVMPLWRVYWLYGVVGSILLSALIVTPAILDWYSAPTIVLALGLGFAYTAWIVVSIWRCAFNIKGEPFGIPRDALAMLARSLTVAWAINVFGMSAVLFQSVMTQGGQT